MNKNYYSLGLMSGTSMDGVDASVIQSDGNSKYKAIFDKYFEIKGRNADKFVVPPLLSTDLTRKACC